MVDKIEMSLDDIIKFSRMKVGGGNRKGYGPRRGGSPRKGNRPSGGSGGGGGGGGGFRGGKRNTQMGGGPGGGGVLKGRNQGIQKAKFNRGDMNSEWKHDLYEVPKRGGFRNFGSNGTSGGAGSNSAKLLVSNLDYGVSESDIQELFADFGPLKSASVHYDRSGRSLGTADVVFERRSDAVKAMKQYNGVPLDGRPMVILLATSDLPTQQSFNKTGRLGGQRSPQKTPNRKFGSGGHGGGPRRNGHSLGGGARQQTGWKQSTKTIEELDAELDAYVNDMK